MSEPLSFKRLNEAIEQMQAAEREAERLYGPWGGFCPAIHRCQHLQLFEQLEGILGIKHRKTE